MLSKKAKFLKSESGRKTRLLDEFIDYENAGFVKICCLRTPIHIPTKEECEKCEFKGTWCNSILVKKEKAKVILT